MRYLLLAISFIAALLSSTLRASSEVDITGTWQGILDGPAGPIRRIMDITKAKGRYSVVVHSIDESEVPIVTHNVTISGTTVTMRFDMNVEPWTDYRRIYRATIGDYGKSISGLWTVQSGPAFPITFHKVAHASWTIIEPKSRMVFVDTNVKDEVLDWGGSGRAVLLLAGLGNTAHAWYTIIPALTSKYHVYSMTRRGFGTSSKPDPTGSNYSADRLGDDVIAAMDAMKLQKPVLIGHSIGGEELSDIGTRYPQKVAALIYLDAGYWYALRTAKSTPPPFGTPPPGEPAMPPIGKAILSGEARPFTGPINVPILAIFADPHDMRFHVPPSQVASAQAQDKKETDAVANGFAKVLPNAKVVRIPNANHYIYISNQDEIVRDINAFIASLPAR